jgi:hypothetical protein
MGSILSIDPHVDINEYAIAIINESGKMVLTRDGETTRGIFNLLDKKLIFHTIVEGQFVGPNARNALGLAASRGGIIALCQVKEISFTTINPMSWKSYIRKIEPDYDVATKRIGKILSDSSEHKFACIGMFLYFLQMTIQQFEEANSGRERS